MSEIPYPNKEHEVADKAARRRARAALTNLREQAAVLIGRLDRDSYLDGSDARQLAGLAGAVAENLAALETLRDVREWAAADQAEASTGS